MFLPWNEKTRETPNVAHDNPADQHLHASVILGFTDDRARDRFYADHAPDLSTLLAPHVAAVHAYDVTDAPTYVKDSQTLPHYES